MKTAVEYREISRNRGLICNDLLRTLPEWFGIEAAIQDYTSAVETMPTIAATVGERVIGFLSLQLHNEWTAEIHVMAVHPDFHRSGIGRELVIRAEKFLRERGFHYLSVKTLSPSRPDRGYEQTRQFYFAMGFRPVEEFKTLWGEANPCLFMIKTLE